MSAKIAAQGRGTRKGIEAKEGPMIHGMLCTLMIGTVLPEPEPPKYFLVLQVVSWQLADRENHALEPPVTAKVIGELHLPVADCFRRTLKTSTSRDPDQPGSVRGELEGWIRQSSAVGDYFVLDVHAGYFRAPIIGGIDYWYSGRDERIQLKGGDRLWLGNCPQHLGTAFFVRLCRVK